MLANITNFKDLKNDDPTSQKPIINVVPGVVAKFRVFFTQITMPPVDDATIAQKDVTPATWLWKIHLYIIDEQ